MAQIPIRLICPMHLLYITTNSDSNAFQIEAVADYKKVLYILEEKTDLVGAKLGVRGSREIFELLKRNS